MTDKSRQSDRVWDVYGAEGAAALRVVVVDDEALMRSGLQMILGVAPDIDVVATCDGPAALTTVARHNPDIVLLDIQMPGVDGLTVLTQLRRLANPPIVAMLTAFASDDFVYTALQQGAVGYLLKDTDPEQLIREVRAMASGGRPLSTGVVPVVIEGFLAHGAATQHTLRAVSALTAREQQVLTLLGHGLTNAEIARSLHLASSTVKDHLSALMAKLGCHNRVQAAVLAERVGLLTRTKSDA